MDLKNQAKHRILVDVIQEVNSKYKGAGTILILDEVSAKLISDIVTFADLTENGIFVVENIHKQRKSYPGFRAIYIIVPDKVNIDVLETDWSSKDGKYSNLHLFFTNRLKDNDFSYLKSKNFIKKAKTIKELNVNVKLLSDYLFRPNQKPAQLETHIDALTSVISYIPQLESIEVFKLKNPIYAGSAQIYKNIEGRVKETMAGNSQGGVNSLKIFIFDRAFDLVTPLIHDFHYESLLVDILGNLELSLNTPDFVLKKFRHKFIRDCMLGIGSDFEKFLNENPIAKIQRNKDNKDVDIDKMGVVVRGITEYNELIKTYETHLDNVKKIDIEIGKKNTNELADLEYTIITGIDSYGENINTDKRLELAHKYLGSLGANKLDQVRLLMIMQGALHTDVSSKKKMIDDPKFSECFSHYLKLVEQYGKYWPKKDKDTLKKVTKMKYNAAESPLQRFTSKAEHLVSTCIKNTKSEHFESYKYGESKVGFSKSPNTLYKGKFNIGKAKTNGHNFVIIYFVGGISYPEIQAFKNLESVLGEAWTFLLGGDNILSAKDFIENISDIANGNKPSDIIEF